MADIVRIRDGHVTVGVGLDGSRGDVNVDQTKRHGAAREAFERAARGLRAVGGGTIEILPGDYIMDDGPWEITTPFEVTLNSGARIIPRNGNMAGAISVLPGADRTRFHGSGEILVDEFIDDQRVVSFFGVRHCRWSIDITMTTDDGLIPGTPNLHSPTPMRLLSFTACPDKHVHDCQIRPRAGSWPIQCELGGYLVMRNVHFGERDNLEVVSPANELGNMEWGIHLRNDGWCDIQGCSFHDIGRSKLIPPFLGGPGPQVEGLLRYDYDTTVVGFGEHGHVNFKNNRCEDVFRNSDITLRGARWFDISNNNFDNSVGEIDRDDQASIVIDREDGPTVIESAAVTFDATGGEGGVGRVTLNAGTWDSTPPNFQLIHIESGVNEGEYDVLSATDTTIDIQSGSFISDAEIVTIRMGFPSEEGTIKGNNWHNTVEGGDSSNPDASEFTASGGILRVISGRRINFDHNKVSTFRGTRIVRIERPNAAVGFSAQGNTFESGRLTDARIPESFAEGPVAAFQIGRRTDPAGAPVPDSDEADIIIFNNICKSGDQAGGGQTEGVFERGIVEIRGNGTLAGGKTLGVIPAEADVAGRII